MGGVIGLSVDAGGTLLYPSEPVAWTYARLAEDHGLERTPQQVREGFARAMSAPWEGLCYVGDGRPFWRHIVRQTLDVPSSMVQAGDFEVLFEALYDHYRHPGAWRVDEALWSVMQGLRSGGVAVGLLSNWDDRLRPLLASLGLLRGLDAVAISCELGVEKPAPLAFEAMADALGVGVHQLLHVGDDEVNDLHGARQAGVTPFAWTAQRGDITELLRSIVTKGETAG